MKNSSGNSFVAILVSDVALAIKRHEISKSQADKRNIVRTSFAALEGFTWFFRQHIIQVAHSTYGLSKEEELTLAETSFQTTQQGRINRQDRFIPLLSMIRLLARMNQRITSKEKIDFSQQGWENVKLANAIRNRITHPKAGDDLKLNQSDVETCLAAMHWMLEKGSDAMAAGNHAVSRYSQDLIDLLEELKAGDPDTTELYDKLARHNDWLD